MKRKNESTRGGGDGISPLHHHPNKDLASVMSSPNMAENKFGAFLVKGNSNMFINNYSGTKNLQNRQNQPK